MATIASITTPPFDAAAQALAAQVQESGIGGLSTFLAAENAAREPSPAFLAQFSSATALLADDGGTPGEPPLIPTARLGLQAVQSVQGAISPQAGAATALAGGEELLRARLAAEAQVFLATLPASAGVDPTQSSLFQAHAGGLATQLVPAAAGLGPEPAEGPGALRVAETFAGAATRAFSEGSAPNENLPGVGRPGPNALAALMPLEGVFSSYTPAGTAIANLPRIGTFLDLTS